MVMGEGMMDGVYRLRAATTSDKRPTTNDTMNHDFYLHYEKIEDYMLVHVTDGNGD